mmetsp:Transcript_96634/g.155883  ORF Transcript_96634/g.155883 Transcript_96634/m.155883 type:complete len:224 (+) Transcript_96634:852-1523(+)
MDRFGDLFNIALFRQTLNCLVCLLRDVRFELRNQRKFCTSIGPHFELYELHLEALVRLHAAGHFQQCRLALSLTVLIPCIAIEFCALFCDVMFHLGYPLLSIRFGLGHNLQQDVLQSIVIDDCSASTKNLLKVVPNRNAILWLQGIQGSNLGRSGLAQFLDSTICSWKLVLNAIFIARPDSCGLALELGDEAERIAIALPLLGAVKFVNVTFPASVNLRCIHM